jgi:hypothetical protein
MPREALGPQRLGVEPDPERDRLDSHPLAGDRRPPLGREAPDAAAPGAQRDLVAEPRPLLDPDLGPSHHPDALLHQSRVDQVEVRDVLQPAADGVDPNSPDRCDAVGDARQERALEDPPSLLYLHPAIIPRGITQTG